MATANHTIAAVAYYRMSSDQQEASIPSQKKAVERYAAEHGYNIVRTYQDDAISGWKEEREGFQRLIRELDRGDFQAVLCWDQNRFSRFPVLEANHYWYLLDRAGCHLATCNQGRLDWSSIAGWITASIKQHGDAQHRFQLSADVKRGKRAVAERGLWQGKIPYGFIVTNRRLVPGDPGELEVIGRIFAEYLGGRSLRGIALALNTEGIPASESSGWIAGSVRSKLTNPAYAGVFHWGETEIRGNHPAVIAPGTFETVQRLLGERKPATTPKTNGGGFLFTGLMKCGKCASPMYGMRTGEGNVYWWCQGHKRKGICDLNAVRQTVLVEHVITAIEQRFMNPKVVRRLREELRRQVAVTTLKADPARLRKELATLTEKLTKATRRLVECDADMLPAVQQAIRDLRGEAERLGASWKASQTPPDALFEAADAKIDMAMSLFGSLRETLQKADPLRLRELFRETVSQIDVWADRKPKGKRELYELTRGVIHVRSDYLVNSPD